MFPQSIQVKDINRTHEEYEEYCAIWRSLDILYEGGAEMRANLGRFLVQKPNEPGPVFETRKEIARYSNVISKGCGWYESAMFNEEISIDGADGWYADFVKNCDGGGTSYISFWREILRSLILYRRGNILIDVPQVDAESLADQEQRGGRDPFLISYEPEDLINWATDDAGNLLWFVLRIETTEYAEEFPHEPSKQCYWHYFDRKESVRYKLVKDKDGGDVAILDKEPAPHATAALGRVPLVQVKLPHVLGLAERAMDPAISHLNKSNWLDWNLFLNAVSTLVLKGNVDENLMKGSWGALRLPTDGDAFYLETSGAIIDTLRTERDSAREDVYRMMYLIQQGRSSEATPAAQSGVSKEADMTPSYEVCESIADVLRPKMVEVLELVAAVRGELDREFSIRGMQPAREGKLNEISEIQQTRALNVQSDTFDRFLDERAIRLAMENAPPKDIEDAVNEAKAAPSKSKRDKAKAEQMAGAFGIAA